MCFRNRSVTLKPAYVHTANNIKPNPIIYSFAWATEAATAALLAVAKRITPVKHPNMQIRSKCDILYRKVIKDKVAAQNGDVPTMIYTMKIGKYLITCMHDTKLTRLLRAQISTVNHDL